MSRPDYHAYASCACRAKALTLLICLAISHIISVPPGPHLLSDVIASSSVLAGEGGAYSGGMGGDGGGEGSGGGGGGGGGNFEFGVDPDMDPELAAVSRPTFSRPGCLQLYSHSSPASV